MIRFFLSNMLNAKIFYEIKKRDFSPPAPPKKNKNNQTNKKPKSTNNFSRNIKTLLHRNVLFQSGKTDHLIVNKNYNTHYTNVMNDMERICASKINSWRERERERQRQRQRQRQTERKREILGGTKKMNHRKK